MEAEAIAHTTINPDHLAKARAGYHAAAGDEAIAPTPVGTFQATYRGQRYIVLGSPRRVLAVYRVRKGVGSLCLLGNWPAALNRLHKKRVLHYHNPPAWPDQRRRSGGIYGVV